MFCNLKIDVLEIVGMRISNDDMHAALIKTLDSLCKVNSRGTKMVFGKKNRMYKNDMPSQKKARVKYY